MPNANDLMTAVASFMGRERSTFIRNGFDVLLRACNNARLYAERTVDFELSRTSVEIQNVSLLNGASLDNAVSALDHSTPVSVKKIKKCFIQFVGNNYQLPIGFYSRSKWLRRVQRNWERLGPLDWPVLRDKTIEQSLGLIQQFAVVQMGRQVYLTPAAKESVGETFTLFFDVLQWLPDYGQEEVIGVASGTSVGRLVNTVGDFINQEVRVGMVVRNTTDGTSATIVAVESGTSLLLNADIFTSGKGYSITTADEEDFLLDSCFDWLLYRSVYELNYFVKEDERVQIAQSLISDAWNSLRSWDENLVMQAVDDTDMD